MAKIQLIIDADDAADLKQTIETLVTFEVAALVTAMADESEADATQDAEPPGERQRRRRRTKAEMEAARGVENSASSSATVGSQPSTSTVNGGEDPFHTSSLDSPVSLNDVRAAAHEKAKPPGSMKGVQEIFEKNFTDADGQPVRQLSKLKEADYGRAVELLAL